MSSNLIQLKSEALSNLQSLTLTRGENPMLCEFIVHSPALGVSSGVLLNLEESDLQSIAATVDRAAGEAAQTGQDFHETLPYHLVSTALPYALLSEPLTGVASQAPEDYPEDQVEALQSVALSALTSTALEIMKRLPDIGASHLNETLNFLTSGDIEARSQALISYPMMAEKLVTNRKFRAIIDARSELGPVIADELGLTAAQMRVYSRFERAISDLTFDPGNPNGATPVKRRCVTRFGHATSMNNIQSIAVQAAQRIRFDQLPAGADADDHVRVLEVLDFTDTALDFEKTLDVGPAPFDRIFRRISATDWGSAKSRLRDQKSKMWDTHDYLRNTARYLTSAILAQKLQDAEGIDMHRISSTAHQLLSEEELHADDAVYLSTFADRIQEKAWMTCRSVLQVIGEHASLKTIAEADARWHHTHGQIDNEMMAIQQNIEWAPLLDEIQVGSLVAKELSSTDALIQQGRRENHCVGSYSRHVLDANHQALMLLFSIESPDGRILSTAELTGQKMQIQPDGPGYSWQVTQHKAKNNASPSREAEAAAEALRTRLEDLSAEEVQTYADRISTNQGNLKEKLSRLVNACGANICETDMPERTMQLIAPLLPKSLRGLSAADWAEAAIPHDQDTKILPRLDECISKLSSDLAALEPARETEPSCP